MRRDACGDRAMQLLRYDVTYTKDKDDVTYAKRRLRRQGNATAKVCSLTTECVL